MGDDLVVTGNDASSSAEERLRSVRQTGRIYPEGQYAIIRSAELVDADEDVAKALGLQVGSPVIRRQRTTFDANGSPLSMSISWFNGALAEQAPLLLSTERLPQGTFGYIAERTDLTVADTSSRHEETTADAEAAQHLNIPAGSPIRRSWNTFRTENGSTVEYSISVGRCSP